MKLHPKILCLKVLIVLLFVSNNLFPQFRLDSIDFEPECIINDEYFIFRIVTIDSGFYSSIDSIVDNYPLKRDHYWYLDISQLNESRQFLLTETNIELFVFRNELDGNENKAILLNSQVIFIRDNNSINICKNSDSWIIFRNKKEAEFEFRDMSYWIFFIEVNKISLLKRKIW